MMLPNKVINKMDIDELRNYISLLQAWSGTADDLNIIRKEQLYEYEHLLESKTRETELLLRMQKQEQTLTRLEIDLKTEYSWPKTEETQWTATVKNTKN